MSNKAFLVRDGLRSGSTLVITSAGSWVGNTITEIYGGTNQTSYTTGDILFASGANTLAKLGVAGAGDVLTLAGGVPTWATPVSAPNSFGVVTGDVGSPSVVADRTSDILQITGGTSITTSVTGSPAVLVITNDAPNVDQNIWLNIGADTGGPVAANTTTDTLTLTGGTGVDTAIAGDVVTFTLDLSELPVASVAGADWLAFDDAGTSSKALISGIDLALFSNSASWAADQNLWLNFNADSGSVAANTTTDTFTFTGGTSITTAIAGDVVTITNDAPNVDQNLWLNIGADSGGPVAANTTTDTLTLTGGDGVDTTIAGDVVTFDVDATVARMSAGSPGLINTGTFIVDTVDLGAVGTFTTSTLTTVSVSQVAVASFAINKYRSAEYTVQAVQGNNFHTTKLLAIHDGTNADSTEFGTITLPSFYGSPAAGSPAISGEQATYDVDISAGDLRLLATPTTTSSTVFKVTAQLTKL